MDRESAMIDVTNLEDCRDKNNIQVIREIFEDARNRLEQGEEIMLLQTQYDSPPEFLERISSRDRLNEIAGYYLP
ncbi:MAG: hypothetical protein V5B78_05900 [Desulfohalobiaceae bacterium]